MKRFYPLFLILMIAVQFLAGSLKAWDFQFLLSPQALISAKMKENLDDIESALRSSQQVRSSASENDTKEKLPKEENIESRQLSVGGPEKSFLSNFGVLTYENIPDVEPRTDKKSAKTVTDSAE